MLRFDNEKGAIALRNYPYIKMVVSDIDGTLVPKGDHISERLYESLRRLKEKHIPFTLATGRSWRQSKHLAEALEITVPVVVQSGALIVDPSNGGILESYSIPNNYTDPLWKIVVPNMDWFHLGISGIYTATKIQTPEGRQLQSYLGEQCQVVESEWSTRGQQTIKLLGVGSRQDIKCLQKIVKTVYPVGRQIVWPGRLKNDGWYLEVFSPEAHKARAVQSIAHGLGFTMDQVLAFGDGDNDRELLTEAGLGGAVVNAPRSIRRAAKCIIDRPEKDGVAKAIDRWVLAVEEEMGWKERFMTFIPTRF